MLRLAKKKYIPQNLKAMANIGKNDENVVVDGEENISSKSSELILKHSVVWSGPLPPPEIFEGYKQIQADFPERILKMAEREQISNHRHIYVGQFSAFIIGLILIIGGILLIFSGHNLAGMTPIILAVASLVGIYLLEKKSVKNNENND